MLYWVEGWKAKLEARLENGDEKVFPFELGQQQRTMFEGLTRCSLTGSLMGRVVRAPRGNYLVELSVAYDGSQKQALEYVSLTTVVNGRGGIVGIQVHHGGKAGEKMNIISRDILESRREDWELALKLLQPLLGNHAKGISLG